MSLLILELLLDTAVEEERDVGVLLRLGDMGLFDALLGKPLGEDVGHGLGWESDVEGELGIVARHCGDVLTSNERSECAKNKT